MQMFLLTQDMVKNAAFIAKITFMDKFLRIRKFLEFLQK